MEVIFISGISMSFFIVILLLTKKQKALSDKILAVWIAVIGIHLLGYYFNQSGYWDQYPHLIGITAPIPLLHGPLLYLYCIHALKSDKTIRLTEYLHLVPAFAAYLYMTRFFFFYTAEQKTMVDKSEINEYSAFAFVLLIAILLSGIVYSVLSFRLTIKHKQKIEYQYSYNERINLKWLRHSIVSIGLVFFSAIIVYLLRDVVKISFPFNPEYIIYTILIIFIFYFGFFGIRHENIFVNNPLPENHNKDKTLPNDKYKNSGLSEETVAKLHQQLLSVMEKDKPYIQPKLSLAELAGMLAISSNQLSQIINQKTGVNFYDFVNKYRVEEFLKQVQVKKNYNLLALALESGFNSKSSFNTIFKKQKGLSPSNFLAQSEHKPELK